MTKELAIEVEMYQISIMRRGKALRESTTILKQTQQHNNNPQESPQL